MIALGGMERTEKRWRKMLEGAGPSIESFVKPEPRGGGGKISECVTECVVAEDDEGKGKGERGERAST